MNDQVQLKEGDPDRKKQKEQQDPKLLEAAKHLLAGNEAVAKEDFETAEREYKKAFEIKPDYRDAIYNLGVICRDADRLDEAEDYFQKVVGLETRAALSHNNLGLIATLREDYETAEREYRQAIDEAFQLAIAHFNLGTMLLRLGRMEEGWRECEWRWQTPSFNPIRCLQPRWDGSQLDGTVLVHTEQGSGDTFQFARFLPMLREHCKKVIFVCPSHLVCMFSQGDWADEVRPPGNFNLNEFHRYLPLMSAPFALKIHDESMIPNQMPYLTPDDRTVDLGSCHVADAKLKVGIAWAGSPTHDNDKHRSMHVKQLKKLLDVPQVAFYSLQKGPQVEQLKELGDTPSFVDLDNKQEDFADTAAIARQLDLIITVDTSILHLAGGLALPTWGMISKRSDWRWMVDREDSPWYPTLTMFRQQQLDNWDEVVDRVIAKLNAVLAGNESL